MSCLKAGYFFDEKAREETNRDNQNYWWSYIAEILDRLGLTAIKVAPAELSQKLPQLSLLFLGNINGQPFAASLDKWVKDGGILIAGNVEGLDEIFGNEFISHLSQKEGEFSLNGKFFLKETSFTRGIHSPWHPEKPLLAASPLRRVKAVHSLEIARGEGTSFITARHYRRGWAFYFSFDIAQTFWVLQQGRPVDRDYDGDGYWRTSDAIVIEDNEAEVAYTDELLFLLQNMVSLKPHPLIHQIPPRQGRIADFLLYYGGDDEGTPGIQVPASEFMRSRGLPYHINLMPEKGKFAVNPQEVAQLKAHKTELSLHFNFMDGFSHPGGYVRDDVRKQTKLYLKEFGQLPVCTVPHYARWTGWAEPALWMSEVGIKSDNCHIHRKSPPINPVNLIGFSFGTSFPYFFWSDYRSGNRRIEFLELPIVAYECGYKNNETDFSQMERVISLANYYQLIMNVFYHPVYIANYPSCRAAIDKLLSLARERNLDILHLGPDEVTRWWLARSKIRIEEITFKNGKLTFFTSCAYAEGFIAKVPLGSLNFIKAGYPHKIRDRFGQRWLFLVLPQGENKVEIEVNAQ